MERLQKNSKDKMVFGVAAGIADYFDMDPTVVRLVFAALCLAGGAGFLLYVVAAIIMPSGEETQGEGLEALPLAPEEDRRKRRNAAAAGLVIVGGIALVSNLGAIWWRWELLWPLLLVGAGLILFARGGRHRRS